MRQYGELLDAIDHAPLEKPGPELRENFQNLLQSELNLQTTAGLLKETEGVGAEGAGKDGRSRETPGKTKFFIPASSPVWRVAAALILLLGGIGIGTRIGSGLRTATSSNDSSSNQIGALQREVKEMKEVLMVSMLDDESASQRLKAVSYVEDVPNPDQKVIGALVNTLNHDKNVNVRLASLYSLARFADIPAVRDSLISSLSGQTEPIIQVVLINILADKKETRAIGPIRSISFPKRRP